jgi:hypothetical protein
MMSGTVFSRRLGHKLAKVRLVNKDRSNVHHDALKSAEKKMSTGAPGSICLASADDAAKLMTFLPGRGGEKAPVGSTTGPKVFPL